jgi:hypothetical protein
MLFNNYKVDILFYKILNNNLKVYVDDVRVCISLRYKEL